MYEVILDTSIQFFFEDLNKAIVKFTDSVALLCNDVVDLYDMQGNRMVRWVRQQGFHTGE